MSATSQSVPSSDPLASVIIPVYNGERHLAEAIESARAQTYRPVEIIVVNDGSTDRSEEIARSYSDVRVVSQENAGVGAARNTGITLARGEFVAYLDHDDIWEPNKLSCEIALLQDNPEIGFLIGRGMLFLEGIEQWPGWARLEIEKSGPYGHMQSALVVRREVFDRVGLFDPSYRLAEDTDWLFRANDAGIAVLYGVEVLMRRRVHASNLSYNQSEARQYVLRAIRASIERKRGQAEPRSEVYS